MGKIAFVFAGQGSQYSGMGKELSEKSKGAKEVFDMADTIRPGTSDQCFNGTKEELTQTINTQPCIFCVDLAAAYALKEQGVTPYCVAGFSLGEIPALAFSGMIEEADAFKLVIKRSEFMNECGKENDGAMLAILGVTSDVVREICKRADGYPVNFNSEMQTVVACKQENVQRVIDEAKISGAKVMKLAVSGGFHSPFMDKASKKMENELENIVANKPAVSIYANVTGEKYGDKTLIFRQINEPVMWQKTIENMISDGVDTFVEVGPGKILSGLIKKINKDVIVLNVEDAKSLENTLEALKNA